MSSSSEVICGEGVMKTTPGKLSSSPRLRKSVQGSNSIYVPPPLRKRKNDSDPKRAATAVPTDKCKVLDVRRSVALHLNSVSSTPPTTNKKCENSYLLFGLEDKSNQPRCNDRHSQENDTIDRLHGKDLAAVKKCDNSYLLFSSVTDEAGEKWFSENCASDKISRKQTSKSEGNEIYNSFPFRNTEALSRVKPLESMIVPHLPDELSCGVGSLSVGNRSFKNASVPIKDTRETKLVKQPSQKKCDNSFFLFDDDDSDMKYGKTPYKEKTQVQTLSPQSFDYRLPPTVCLDRPDRPSPMSQVTDNSDCIKDKVSKVGEHSPDNVEMSQDLNNGKPEVQTATNTSLEMSDNIEDYVIEIYDFPKTLRTQDIMGIFSLYVQEGFFIKWVDDTHALGIFSNTCSVSEVLKKKFDLVSIRGLQCASPAAIEAASTVPIPSGSRPRTCPSLARRLVSGALGLRVSVSDEIRKAEKKMLQDAKEERRLAAKQREEAWEGTLRSNLPS